VGLINNHKGEKRMKSRKLFSILSLLVVDCLLVACGGIPPTEARATSTGEEIGKLSELITAAQVEGTLNLIAVPDWWCNYGEAIETFKSKYGLEVNQLEPNATAEEEFEAINANKDNPGPQSPDVIDVAFLFSSSFKAEGLIQPYKVVTWNTIPDSAKDPEGYWYGGYYSVLSFLVNTDVQPDVPQDWVDLLDPKYKGQVALSGDPRNINEAMQSVFAAALANGGSLDNAQPGLEFFAKLNEAGNLIPLTATRDRVASGETPIRITWDFEALAAAESFAGHPKTEFVIPANGRFAEKFVLAISAYAPHPNAAKLWMEFLYSDEGQLFWMKGYCRPIREIDMRARGVVPEDLLAKLPDVSDAVFPTVDQLNRAKVLINEEWDAIVGAEILPAP
jgi:putative spermidine/putrescine transport system substrate-binding protein